MPHCPPPGYATVFLYGINFDNMFKFEPNGITKAKTNLVQTLQIQAAVAIHGLSIIGLDYLQTLFGTTDGEIPFLSKFKPFWYSRIEIYLEHNPHEFWWKPVVHKHIENKIWVNGGRCKAVMNMLTQGFSNSFCWRLPKLFFLMSWPSRNLVTL